MWEQQQQYPAGNVYFISQTDWGPNNTHFTGLGSSGAFGNGYIPLFAVIGANNECFYNDNYFANVESALNLAIESFGLAAFIASNVTEGPADLGVQFFSNSTPGTGIESWEWDFDGDGEIDSTQEDPYYLYTEEGSYDVTLTVTMDGETSTVTNEDYIVVNDGTNIAGPLSGIWYPGLTYIVTDDVSIEDGDELVLIEGTEVIFEEDTELTINGLLVADASTARGEPIILTSETFWDGIRFFDTQDGSLLNNCEISNASISAIRIEGDSNVDVVGCKIYNNNATASGAAFDITGSTSVNIYQNVITNNTSTNNAGAIACTASLVDISNNIITNNEGQWGAFSFKNDSDVSMTNNTVANNLSTNTTPYLMFLLNSVPEISNSIIIDSGEIYFPQSTPEVTYSCVTGGFTGEGNIDADPLFADPTEGDGIAYDGMMASWMLQESSPCIDAGNPDAMYNDLDGTRNDMGAYGGPTPCEYDPTDSEETIINIAAVNAISVYPNPFNPSTNIALAINENDIQLPLSVEIFNIKGQLVKTIVKNEVIQTTNFTWNGTDNKGNSTSSGMYFVKLKTATSEASKKMLLLK